MNEHYIEITIRSHDLCLNHQMHYIHNRQQRGKNHALPIRYLHNKTMILLFWLSAKASVISLLSRALVLLVFIANSTRLLIRESPLLFL